jgi:peroxiredoxin
MLGESVAIVADHHHEEKTMSRLMPRQPVPELAVPLVAGGEWRLADQTPDNFTLICFYRGMHCPICKTYVKELDRLVDDFAQRGVNVVAISSDTQERAGQTVADWRLENLDVGYDLGLYVSTSRGKTSLGIVEPDLFSEPGVFAVRPDGTLYMGSVNTMPFARTHFSARRGVIRGRPARPAVGVSPRRRARRPAARRGRRSAPGVRWPPPRNRVRGRSRRVHRTPAG